MSGLRKKNGQFKKGHHKVAKKHHHRKNPIGVGALARLGASLKAAGGAGRVARVLVVRA